MRDAELEGHGRRGFLPRTSAGGPWTRESPAEPTRTPSAPRRRGSRRPCLRGSRRPPGRLRESRREARGGFVAVLLRESRVAAYVRDHERANRCLCGSHFQSVSHARGETHERGPSARVVRSGRLSKARPTFAQKDIWRGASLAATFASMSSRALLLAEAEPGTREFLERHLASDGFEVLRAAAQELTLELVERVRPDLVLVGGLEDASGPDVCKRLREGEPGRTWDRDVPVIVLGERRADAVDRVHAFERGCDDFVPRPFHYEELVARIHAVLRRARPAMRERLAGRADRARARDAARHGPRPSRRACGEGVRAAREARDRSDARLHEGGAAARGLGLRLARPDPDARLACLAAAAEARAGGRRRLRPERLGRGVSPAHGERGPSPDRLSVICFSHAAG